MMPRDLFEQVFLATDIHAVAGGLNGPAIRGALDLEAKAFENAFDDRIFNGGAEETLDPAASQSERDWFALARINIDNSVVNLAAGQLLDQGRGAIAGVARHFDITATLEPIGRFGRQAERA